VFGGTVLVEDGGRRSHGDTMNITVRAEDIMTPRRLLKYAANETDAEVEADRGGFDAVPLLRRDGRGREFWSRMECKTMRIASQGHRTGHDSAVERLLPALGEHVQFVYYRSEGIDRRKRPKQANRASGLASAYVGVGASYPRCRPASPHRRQESG